MKTGLTSKSDVGKFGEKTAEKFLKKNKYKIIGRNVNAGRSEIDIVALKDQTLVFVEVKTRSYDPDKEYISRPADAVNREKITYLIRGADRFCTDSGSKYSEYFKRFDIIEIYLTNDGGQYSVADIRHFENAFGRN